MTGQDLMLQRAESMFLPLGSTRQPHVLSTPSTIFSWRRGLSPFPTWIKTIPIGPSMAWWHVFIGFLRCPNKEGIPLT